MERLPEVLEPVAEKIIKVARKKRHLEKFFEERDAMNGASQPSKEGTAWFDHYFNVCVCVCARTCMCVHAHFLFFFSLSAFHTCNTPTTRAFQRPLNPMSFD